jgi:hypothetical protein
MNELAQEAVLVGLARRLGEHGSWSGETHIQKAAYLVHEIADVPFEFDFILYKHGPFSFELREELSSMRLDGLLERQPQPAPYGPRIATTERGRHLEERFQTTMRKYGPRLDWVAERIGSKNVSELERLATALWITRQGDSTSEDDRAEELTRIKPHVDRGAALVAVRQIDELLQEATSSLA